MTEQEKAAILKEMAAETLKQLRELKDGNTD